MDIKLGLEELIRSTEVVRNALTNREAVTAENINDIVKFNKSLVQLYQALHLIEMDDLVERNELLEKKVAELTEELHDLKLSRKK